MAASDILLRDQDPVLDDEEAALGLLVGETFHDVDEHVGFADAGGRADLGVAAVDERLDEAGGDRVLELLALDDVDGHWSPAGCGGYFTSRADSVIKSGGLEEDCRRFWRVGRVGEKAAVEGERAVSAAEKGAAAAGSDWGLRQPSRQGRLPGRVAMAAMKSVIERIGDGVRRLGGVGAGVLGVGAMAAEGETLIEFVRFIEKLLEDPKGVIEGWFGGGREGGAAGAVVKEGGTPANPLGIEKVEAKAHVPGQGVDVTREIAGASGAKSPAEVYLEFAAAEKKAGRAVVPGTIVELTFASGRERAHVNLEAVDGDRFRFADGQAGAAFVTPSGFDSAAYGRDFAARGAHEGVMSAAAEMGARGGGRVIAGPPALGALGLSGDGRKAIDAAAAALGGRPLAAGESGDMRKAGPPGAALVSCAGGLGYVSFVGGDGVTVGAGAAAGRDGRKVVFAGRESDGVSRIGVALGAAGVDLGRGGGVEVSGARGRPSLGRRSLPVRRAIWWSRRPGGRERSSRSARRFPAKLGRQSR